VTSNQYRSDEAGADLYVGWWVGSDGNWHPPDEPFEPDRPERRHPIRRMAVVILAIALLAATSVGAWEGASSSSSYGGPSPAQLNAQVRSALTGTGADHLGIAGVSNVQCHPPSSWNAGNRFNCEIYGTSQSLVGHYDGTVVATSFAGEWRWDGVWKPIHRSLITD
jgi:hypothetical protein